MTSEEQHSLCEMRQTQDMGIGMFATEDIPPNTTITVENAIVTSPKTSIEDVLSTLRGMDEPVLTKYRDLHCASNVLEELQSNEKAMSSVRDWCVSNSDHREGEGLAAAVEQGARDWAIFQTNCAEINSKAVAIFAEFSRFNHSCQPNAMWDFVLPGEDNKLSLRTVSDQIIKKGEQVFLSYLPDLDQMPRDRRQKLLSCWGFTCGCGVCSNPDDI